MLIFGCVCFFFFGMWHFRAGNDSPSMVGEPRLIHVETATGGKSLGDMLFLPQSLGSRHWVECNQVVSTSTYILDSLCYAVYSK